MLLVIISTNVEKGFKSLKFKTLKVEKPLKSKGCAVVKPLKGVGVKKKGAPNQGPFYKPPSSST
jgi:hypothetical protein